MLLLQLWLMIAKVSPPDILSYCKTIAKFFSFMTIWTNILVAGVVSFPLLLPKNALSKYLSRPFIQGAVLVYILHVSIAYHILLADIWNPQGGQKVADISLHYAMPAIYLIFWIIFVPKGFFRVGKVHTILIYPL